MGLQRKADEGQQANGLLIPAVFGRQVNTGKHSSRVPPSPHLDIMSSMKGDVERQVHTAHHPHEIFADRQITAPATMIPPITVAVVDAKSNSRRKPVEVEALKVAVLIGQILLATHSIERTQLRIGTEGGRCECIYFWSDRGSIFSMTKALEPPR